MRNVGDRDVEGDAQGRTRDGNRSLFYILFVVYISSLCVSHEINEIGSLWEKPMLDPTYNMVIVTIHRLRIDAIFTATAYFDFNYWSRMKAKDYYCYCYVGRDRNELLVSRRLCGPVNINSPVTE